MQSAPAPCRASAVRDFAWVVWIDGYDIWYRRSIDVRPAWSTPFVVFALTYVVHTTGITVLSRDKASGELSIAQQFKIDQVPTINASIQR